MTEPTIPPSSRWLAGGLFFASGSAGLIYQVVWTREVTLLVGGTTIATGLVLALFLGGLGLGAWLGGRWTTRHGGSLRLYAILEAAIALCGALALPVLRSLDGPIGALWRACEPHLTAASVAACLVVGVVLFIPTLFMGATLPVLCQAFIRRHDQIANETGRLYGLNTLGASFGALVTAFALIPAFGMTTSAWIAAAVNGAVAVIAWLAGGKRSLRAPPPAPAEAGEAPVDATPSPRVAAAVIFGVSGFCALLYEVAWTRTLSLAVGSSTYAFGAMLSVFILGLGLGGLGGGRWAARHRGSLATLGWLQAAIGFSVIAGLPLLGQVPLYLLRLPPEVGRSFGSWTVVILGCAAGVMLLPAFASGMMFPVLNAIAVRDAGRIGRWVGVAYGVNTLGSVAGSLTGAFVLLPRLGLEGTLAFAAALQVASAAVTLRLASASIGATLRAGALFAGAAAALALCPRWDPAIVSSGVFLSPYWAEDRKLEQDPEEVREAVKRGMGTLLFRAEGAHGSVVVHEVSSGSRVLRINGKSDASESGDMATQTLVAVAPLLLRPNPSEIFVLGLGSGVTAGILAGMEPSPRVTVAEFVPEVIEAARLFEKVNFGVNDRPNVEILPVDGRACLAYSARTYDLIVSEPSNPWQAGMAHCFTDEFFRIARTRLRPGGLFVQWVQGYGLGDREFTLLLETFRDVFPCVYVWEGAPSVDFILVGSVDPPEASWAAARTLLETRHFREIGATLDLESPGAWLGFFVGGPDACGRIPPGGERHTDDRMQMEMRMARLLNQNMWGSLGPLLVRLLESPEVLYADVPAAEAARLRGVPAMRRAMYEALAAQYDRRHDEAIYRFDQAWRAFPHGPMGPLAASLRVIRAKARLEDGNREAALTDLDAAHNLAPRDEEIALLRAETQFRTGRGAEALASAGRISGSRSARARAADLRGLVQLDQGDFEAAVREFREALALGSRQISTLFNLSGALRELKRPAEALPFLEEAATLSEGSIEVLTLQAVCLEEAGRPGEARVVYESILGGEPVHPIALAGRGRTLLAEGRVREAIEALTRAIAALPEDASVLRERAKAYRALSPPDEERATGDDRRAKELER
ncbi:MAG: fused MFS/spermidine synthase [Planctomycetes bacterium]|nr:fused MFS/spermidine synthase [Planctomycetota bacterium]